MKALLMTSALSQTEPHGHAKRYHSIRTTEAGYDSHARKKERTDLKDAMRASVVDEEARQIRSREMVAEESSSIPVFSERRTMMVQRLMCAPLIITQALML